MVDKRVETILLQPLRMIDQGTAAAQFAHVAADGLRREELRAQVDVERVVPVLDVDIVDAVALVVGGVVDQDSDRAEVGTGLLDGRFQGVNIGHIAMDELRARLRCEGIAGLRLDVHERHFHRVGGKGAHDIGADARGAAGHKGSSSSQAGVGSEVRNGPALR